MSEDIDEIGVMSAIRGELEKVADKDTRKRILDWIWSKYGDGDAPTQGSPTREKAKRKSKANPKAKAKSKARSGKTSFSIVKDLNLRPKDKQSFSEFIAALKLTSNSAKCLAALYYLERSLEMDQIGFDHIYTCYRDQGWKVPDIGNTMRVMASRNGYVDTQNSTDLKVTVQGENQILHDLPKKPDA